MAETIARAQELVQRGSGRLAVRDTEAAGRGLFAVKPCRKGDLLLSTLPFAYVPSSKVAQQRCYRCLAESQSLSRCSVCQKTKYCSRTCQVDDWPRHKRECKVLKTAPRSLPDSAALICRIADLLYEQKKRFSECDLALLSVGHTDSSRDMDHASIVAVVQTFLREQKTAADWLSPADMLHLVRLMSTNSFSICDAEMQPIGVGLYPSASFFNHSCRSNAVATFNSVTLNIRAVADIPTGTEVTISYIDVFAPTSTRRAELSSRYGFKCVCTLCLDVEIDTKATGVCCERASCVGLYLPPPTPGNTEGTCTLGCAQQGTNYDQVKAIEQRTQTLAAPADTEPKRLQVHVDSLVALQAYVPATNINYANFANKAMDLALNLQDWDMAVKWGACAIPAMRLVFSDVHPLLGLQFMKLGKMMLVQSEIPPDCVPILKEALKILEVTHGATHPLVRDCGSLLQQAMAETQATHQSHGPKFEEIDED